MNEQIKNSISAFVQTLRKMFMIDDAAELDFGIYRIMAQKKAEIEAFFGLNDESDENALCRKIEKLLAEQQGASVDVKEIKKQLEDRIRMYKEDGDTMEQINKKPKIVELRRQLEDCGDPSVMLPRVLTALNDFFSRYYDNGDFISQRRYANGDDATYLVPYNGEEVKLHWANYDQFYIKTSEAFKNYRFKLSNGKEVEFTLKNAAQLKNNEKEQKDWGRKFKLWDGVSEPEEEPTPDFVPVQIEEDGVLHIYFTYELMPKKGNEQDTLNEETANVLYPIIQKIYYGDYSDLLQVRIKNKKQVKDILHLYRYTTRNSSDYFIHKNLSDFLCRELDFFLKNEVMNVSDLDYNNLRRTLAEAKTIKAVGEEIIQMLAGIEDFQKKLWLKKKFVVQSDYCITLDRVPVSLYEEICANEKQRDEWVHLFAIDEIEGLMGVGGYSVPLTVEFLDQNQHLVLDTAFFSADFKHRLLSSIKDIDAQCDGLLINSENFQALELLQEKYQERVKCVYIDPPYNIGGDDFLYKDNYSISSWMSLMDDRISKGYSFLDLQGAFLCSIGPTREGELRTMLNGAGFNTIIPYVWKSRTKPTNTGDAKLAPQVVAEFVYMGLKCDKYEYNPILSGEIRKYTNTDTYGKYRTTSILTSNLGRYNRETMRFPIGNYTPPSDKRWKAGFDEINSLYKNHRIGFNEDGDPFRKHYEGDEEDMRIPFWTFIPEEVSGSAESGKTDLSYMIPGHGFDTVKPKELIEYFLNALTTDNGIVLDYFAGSGTTADAVIRYNSEANIKQKYILIEGQKYFDNLTKPRIQKVIYSKDWKDGMPISREGSSHCFKYLRLEQYEDTLNNLYREPKDGNGWFEEKLAADTIGYVMDMQSQQNWMHTDWMANPFDVKMQITRSNEKTEQTIDVVETFNYLIGLNVEKLQWPEAGMQVVTGVTRKGKRTMVIWRNTTQITDEQVKKYLDSVDYKPFKQIYLNGETTLGTILDGKLRQTETEFEYRMFAQDKA